MHKDTKFTEKELLKLGILALASSNLLGITSAAETESVNLGRSVVSATGYEQDIKDAPASISVIPSEEILTRPIRDIGDAVQDVPGVQVESSKTGGNTISMRGLDSGYTLILIDGKRQNVAQGFDANGWSGTFTGFMPPAAMIERIEVIRGPASTIYGSDAMGGVINIITKKHVQKISSGVQLDTRLPQHNDVFGNIYSVNAYTTIPIIVNKLSLNVRGGYKYGGQNKFLKPDGLQGQSASAARNPYSTHSATGFTNWNAGARLTYTANANNEFYFDTETYYARTGSLNTSAQSLTVIRDFYKFNNVLSHNANYDWGRINSYAQYSQTMWAPHSGVNIGASKGSSVDWDSGRDNKDIILQSTYNNNYNFNQYGSLIFNGGLYYMWEQLHNKANGFKRHMNQVAVFGEGEYFINDYVSSTLGLRYNYSDIFSAVPNPRFYVNFSPTQWLMLKAGITSGVRVPNLTYLYDGWDFSASNTGRLGNKDLKPEQSWNYEVSGIIDLDPSFFVLTGFFTDFRDQIENIPYTDAECTDMTTCSTYRNLDKSRMSGVEASFKLKPINGFSLDSSYAFTNTEILSVANPAQQYLVGEPVNSIPKHNFTITPRYKYQQFDTYIRWNGKFQTPTPTPTPTNAAGGADTVRAAVGKYYKNYQTVDVAFNYNFLKNYNVTFAVNNIFDVNFYDPILYATSAGLRNSTYTNQYQRILPSRTFWLSLRADF